MVSTILIRLDSVIDIYKTTMLNGYKVQISFIKSLNAWVIGQRSYLAIIRDKNDLTNIFDSNFHFTGTSLDYVGNKKK